MLEFMNPGWSELLDLMTLWLVILLGFPISLFVIFMIVIAIYSVESWFTRILESHASK